MAIFNSYVGLPKGSCCHWLDEQFPAAWFSAASPCPIQGSSDENLISMIKQEQLWPLISLTGYKWDYIFYKWDCKYL